MESEQSRTVEAVRTAIQMEIDGKEFYLKAGQAAGNELGKKLFQQLAVEEDRHREKFVEIFQALQDRKSWPEVRLQTHDGDAMKTLFAAASRTVKASDTELDAVQTAMEMENKTRDFYQERAEKAGFAAEKQYYGLLVQEERAHHALLLDYYEYMKNPAGYFTMKERHSLDGG